jgi:hypothetical protein
MAEQRQNKRIVALDVVDKAIGHLSAMRHMMLRDGDSQIQAKKVIMLIRASDVVDKVIGHLNAMCHFIRVAGDQNKSVIFARLLAYHSCH